MFLSNFILVANVKVSCRKKITIICTVIIFTLWWLTTWKSMFSIYASDFILTHTHFPKIATFMGREMTAEFESGSSFKLLSFPFILSELLYWAWLPLTTWRIWFAPLQRAAADTVLQRSKRLTWKTTKGSRRNLVFNTTLFLHSFTRSLF